VTTRHRIRLRQYQRQAEGYLEIGLPQQALDALARLGKAETLGSHALYLRGKALTDLGRFAEALVPLEEVVDADPENVHVRLVQGWCHKRIGRLDLAVRDLETALRAHPDDALLHYNLACYQSLARNKRRALRHLSRALVLDASYRSLIDGEADFDPLRSDADFQALLGIGV
jgi:tetratricopeptide (TPR) repeat protein